MKLTPDQLRKAHGLAEEIRRLEALREHAQDTPVRVNLGPKPSASDPLAQQGINGLLSQMGITNAGVDVVIPATTIRAALVDQLAPMYDQLRQLGIEIQL